MGVESGAEEFDGSIWVKQVQHRWIEYEGTRPINMVGDLGTIVRDFLRQELREFKTNYEKYGFEANVISNYITQLDQFIVGRTDQEFGNLQTRKDIERIQAEINKIKIDAIPQLTFWKILSTFGLALFTAMTTTLLIFFDDILQDPRRVLPILFGYIGGFALLAWGLFVLYRNDQKKLNRYDELF